MSQHEVIKPLDTVKSDFQTETYENESIADGQHCPKITISTSEKTEFVTISFVSSIYSKCLNILMTKSQFEDFASNVTNFSNRFITKTKAKKLIK